MYSNTNSKTVLNFFNPNSKIFWAIFACLLQYNSIFAAETYTCHVQLLSLLLRAFVNIFRAQSILLFSSWFRPFFPHTSPFRRINRWYCIHTIGFAVSSWSLMYSCWQSFSFFACSRKSHWDRPRVKSMGKAIDDSWYTLNAASGSFVENSYLANSYQIVGKCRKVHKHLLYVNLTRALPALWLFW